MYDSGLMRLKERFATSKVKNSDHQRRFVLWEPKCKVCLDEQRWASSSQLRWSVSRMIVAPDVMMFSGLPAFRQQKVQQPQSRTGSQRREHIGLKVKNGHKGSYRQ